MKLQLSPPAKLSFGLTAFVVSLGLVAYSLGLMPSAERETQDARASLAAGLATPLAVAMEKGDVQAMQGLIEPVVARRGPLSAITLTGPEGAVLAQSRDGLDSASVADRVEVRLNAGDALLGKIVFEFRPPGDDGRLWGLPSRTMALLGFVTIVGYAGFFFYLKRALRVLNGGDAVPERVASAFDTLTEGVLFERRLFFGLFSTEDQKEGMQAFVEKRPAAFKNR